MREMERKRLWALSGNLCAFPNCKVELVSDPEATRVMGREAHIKGEKPGSPRHDPKQTEEEREGYDNKILLCPTHHDEIDSNEKKWTVEIIRSMKAIHEKGVVKNRRYPDILEDLGKLYKAYSEQVEVESDVLEIIKKKEGKHEFNVKASTEEGLNTSIFIEKGDKIKIYARGLVSYYPGSALVTPEGILCNEYGFPIIAYKDEKVLIPAVFPHDEAYKTDREYGGLVGSLFGWIHERDPENSFFIGTKKELIAGTDGYLYLCVNDAAGTYADNDGEFFVQITVESKT